MSVERCKQLFVEGHNCAQAVIGGFAKEIGLAEEKAMALASCLGAGISGTRQTCGAILGGLMVIGSAENDVSVDGKKAMYDKGKLLLDDFTERFSTTVCKELLTNAKAYFAEAPLERTTEYYKQRPCLLFVEAVAEYLEKALSEK